MPVDTNSRDALQSLIDEGWIAEELFEIKSGKEATVYCCRGGPLAPEPLVAAKVYRPIELRRFKNDALYRAGRAVMAHDTRYRRALQSKTAFGRSVQQGTWIGEEWETLEILHEEGVHVPRPLRHSDRVILMAYLGNEAGPAPRLSELRLDRATVAAITDALLLNVEWMLDLECVHGDLSPYNVLYWEGRATIIDFPQAVDPRLNSSAHALLVRDVEQICAWARRHRVNRPAAKIARRLWARFREGELG